MEDKIRTYKAFVINPEGIHTFLEMDYPTKAQFKSDLKANGYKTCFISTPENCDADAEK
jgi:hypothetical protein